MNTIVTIIDEYIKRKKEAKIKKVTDKYKNYSAEDKEILLNEELDTIEEDFYGPYWINNISKRACQIDFSTHVSKFNHGKSKGSDFLSIGKPKKEGILYVGSDCLDNPAMDVSVNATHADVVGFLFLKDEHGNFLYKIIKDDCFIFDKIASYLSLSQHEKKVYELDKWLGRFRDALSGQNRQIKSHIYNKQVYFPVGDGIYHLISPLYSSSLSQCIYDRVQDVRYTAQANEARKAHRENKISKHPAIYVNDLAVMTHGGSKPLNISMLNAKRGGKTYLFPSTPPAFEEINIDKGIVFFCRNPYLDTYLAKKWKGLLADEMYSSVSFDKSKDINEALTGIINGVIDFLWILQKKNEGWSDPTSLHECYKVWLDSQYNKKYSDLDKDMQHDIKSNFSYWLYRISIKESDSKRIKSEMKNYIDNNYIESVFEKFILTLEEDSNSF